MQPKSYSIDPTSFTPVTKESFEAWTIKYKERIAKERIAKKDEFEGKPTGK